MSRRMDVASLLQSSPPDRRPGADERPPQPQPQPLPQQQHKPPPLQHSPTQPLPPQPIQQPQAPPRRTYFPGPPPPSNPQTRPSSFDLRDASRPPQRERERERDRDNILYAPVNEPSPMYTPPAPESGPGPGRGQRQHHPPHPPVHHHAAVVPMSVTVERRQHRPGSSSHGHSHSHSHSQPPVQHQQGGGGGGHSSSVPPGRDGRERDGRERERDGRDREERERRHVDTAVGMDVDHPSHHRPSASLSPRRLVHVHGHTHTAHVHHPRPGSLVDAPHPHHAHQHTGHTHAHVLPGHQHHPHPPQPPQPQHRPEPKQIKHLGSYTLPTTPFPYTFSARDTGCSVRLTLIIPRRALPEDSYAPRIWGGCAGGRDGAVYTDDSDYVGAAVHAGFLKWSSVVQARERGADLQLELELRNDVVRYVGGVGRAYSGGLGGEEEVVGVKEEGKKRNGYGHGRRDEEDDEEDDGRSVVSAGWGNGHDGAGFEILRARLIPTGTAHGTRRARTLRLKELATRRAEMMLTPRTMKRGYPFGEDEEEDAYGPEARARKAAIVQPKAMEPEARPTILLSSAFGWEGNVYRYDPTHLRHALFPPPPPKRARKRPRRDSSSSHSSQTTSSTPPRTVILETACERFAVKPVGGEGGKWEIVLLGRFGRAAMGGLLSRANSDYGGASPLPRSPLPDSSQPSPPQPSLLTPYTNSNTLIPPGPSTPGAETSSGLPAEYPAHDLTRSSFAFAPDELRILGPPEARSGARAGWALDVRRWWIEQPAPAQAASVGQMETVVEGEENEVEREREKEDDRMDEGEVVGSGVNSVEMPEPVIQQTATIERAPVRGAEGAVVPSAAASADRPHAEPVTNEVEKTRDEGERKVKAEALEEEETESEVVPPGMLPLPVIDAEAEGTAVVRSSAQVTEEPAGAGGAVAEPAVALTTSDAAPAPVAVEPAVPADVASVSHPGDTVASEAKDTAAAEQQADKPADPVDAARAMGFEPAPPATAPAPPSAPISTSVPIEDSTAVSSTASTPHPTTVPTQQVSVVDDVEDGEIGEEGEGGEAPPRIEETVSAAAPGLAGAGAMDIDA